MQSFIFVQNFTEMFGVLSILADSVMIDSVGETSLG